MYKNWFLEIIIAKGQLANLDLEGKIILKLIQLSVNTAMVKNGKVTLEVTP
jgi:hypothetical protein